MLKGLASTVEEVLGCDSSPRLKSLLQVRESLFILDSECYSFL